MKVLFLFGPNLGALGRRRIPVYGAQTLGEIMSGVEGAAARLDHEVGWRQSDSEGELVQALLAAAGERYEAVILNPGALSHYSYALRDAVEACGLPVIEVHMSNVFGREEFRRRSVVSAASRGVITGFGAGGYHLALEALPWISS